MIKISQADSNTIFVRCSDERKTFNKLRYGPVTAHLRIEMAGWANCFELTFESEEYEDNFVLDYGDLILDRYDTFDDF